MAGATAIGVGSAVYYRGLDAFRAITAELRAFMQVHGYHRLSDIIGLAHRSAG